MVVRPLAACLVVWTLSAAAAAAQTAPRIPRPVRSSTRWGLDLIHEGEHKSAAFRRLVEELGATDVVVYVQPAQQLPGVTEAVTEFVTATGPCRYLRIWIGVRAVRKRLISLLGHELQHALEIGRAPEVVDVATLEAFYRQNGEMSVDGYDTDAARRMGEVILRQLWSAPASLATPRVTRN
jgi:hypothetical protein